MSPEEFQQQSELLIKMTNAFVKLKGEVKQLRTDLDAATAQGIMLDGTAVAALAQLGEMTQLKELHDAFVAGTLGAAKKAGSPNRPRQQLSYEAWVSVRDYINGQKFTTWKALAEDLGIPVSTARKYSKMPEEEALALKPDSTGTDTSGEEQETDTDE